MPIDTQYGRLYLYLGQALEATAEHDQFRLRTRQYWYRIQHDASLQTKAALRWEYDSQTPRDTFCRHHAQLASALTLGKRQLDLDKAHLPTGWVTIEEVIRFLIVELGMTPPCGDGWPEVLDDSERRFFEEFTGKRHKPPPEAG